LLVAGLLVLPAGEAVAAKPTTPINLETVPSGAEVSLLEPAPEKLLGVTPLKKVRVPRGPIRLRFRLAGHEDRVEVLTIAAATATYNYTLTRIVQPATVELTAGEGAAGAEVHVDGQLLGTVPVKVLTPPGRHQILVKKAGFVDWEKWVEVTENQLVSLEVALKAQERPRGSLAVSSAPVGADVKVNGAPRGQAPVAIEGLEPGIYEIELHLDGYKSFRQQVTVREGTLETFAGTLEPLAAQLGELKVLCDLPRAVILLDGEERGPAPALFSELKPGEHIVECRAPDFPPTSLTVAIVAGQSRTIALNPRLAVASQRGSISVVSSVTSARARLNEGEWKKTPATFEDLKPGKYAVTVEADGHAAWSATATVEAQQITEVTATLQATGLLHLRAPAGKRASVFVDGVIAGETPLTLQIPVGPHRVRFQAEGALDEEHDVAILPGATAVVDAKLVVPVVPRPVRRSNPTSAQTQEPGRGSVQLGVGVPAIFEATVSSGIVENLEAGVQIRNTLHVLTEFELQGQYRLYGTEAFAVGVEAGLGGGLGTSDRSAFTGMVRPIASLLMGQNSSFSVYGQLRFFADTVSAAQADDRLGEDQGDTSCSGLLFPLGLQGEFMVKDSLNFWIRAEMDLLDSDEGRLIYGELGEWANGRFRGGLGVTWLYN
jgi:hypothetical protein